MTLTTAQKKLKKILKEKIAPIVEEDGRKKMYKLYRQMGFERFKNQILEIWRESPPETSTTGDVKNILHKEGLDAIMREIEEEDNVEQDVDRALRAEQHLKQQKELTAQAEQDQAKVLTAAEQKKAEDIAKTCQLKRQELTKLQNSVSGLENAVRKLEDERDAQKKPSKKRLKELNKYIENAEKKIVTKNREIEDIEKYLVKNDKTYLQEQRAKLTELKDKLTELENKLSKLQQQNKNKRINDQIDKLKKQTRTYKAQIEDREKFLSENDPNYLETESTTSIESFSSKEVSPVIKNISYEEPCKCVNYRFLD